jgi:hypothetical protein
MEKILFRFIYNLHYIQVVYHICEHHGWFLELVNSIGVRCCGNPSRISSATDYSEIDIMDLEEMVSNAQEIEAMIRELNTPMDEEELMGIRKLAEALGSSHSSSDED